MPKKNYEYANEELAEISLGNPEFKSPAFQFYVNDVLGSNRVMILSDVEFRAYFNLLYASWNEKDCGLPTDVGALVRLSRVSGSLSGENLANIKQFFFEYRGRLFNRRLLEERIKQIKKRETATNNINKRYQTPTNILTKHLPTKGLSEKEIENEIEDEVINKKEEKKKEKFGEFVSMAQTEYDKLISEHGEELTKKFIETLNNYKGATGKKYKSDYLAILNWVIDKVKKENNGIRTSIKDNRKGAYDKEQHERLLNNPPV